MFAYCLNNPVGYTDLQGYLAAVFYDTDGEMFSSDELDERSGGGNRGFWQSLGDSFRDAARGIGMANGEKFEVHHVVEQCQGNKSGFSNSDIQAQSNKIALPYSVHRKISGHYSSLQPYTNGLRVRNWLAGKPFDVQSEYGWKLVGYYLLGE